jgi:D-amino-acid dehydrogenase
METSYAKGGQLSDSDAEVWNSAPLRSRRLDDGYFAAARALINLAPGWRKYSQVAEFVWMATVRLAIEGSSHGRSLHAGNTTIRDAEGKDDDAASCP